MEAVLLRLLDLHTWIEQVFVDTHAL